MKQTKERKKLKERNYKERQKNLTSHISHLTSAHKGITLIALVITIIIMLILATVSIRIAVNGGLFKYAGEAVKRTEIEQEKEVVWQEIISYRTSGKTEEVIGMPLTDKNMDGDWEILIMNENKEKYGTNWTYITEGTDIEGYGKTKHNWLANYETGEIIELKKGDYTMLGMKDTLEVPEDFIINLDSTIIEGITNKKEEESTKEYLEKKLSTNMSTVTLEGFNFEEENQNSGLTKTSLNFDGKDDYIKIKYDNEEAKQKLAEKGLTFEFYGKITGDGFFFKSDGTTFTSPYRGLFGYWTGNEKKQADLRFGFEKEERINLFVALELWLGAKRSDRMEYCFLSLEPAVYLRQ